MTTTDSNPTSNTSRRHYLHERAARQREAGLVFEGEPMRTIMAELGAKGISVPDPLEPFQICLDLYYGETTPRATSEIPHWHKEQTEAYVMTDEGEAEVWVKWRWDDDGWQRRVLRQGDVILVQPHACHWFRWRSERGRATVFKAPQIPGVGKPPNGKTTCANGCPHFQRGCVTPNGFNPI
jgi:Cupin domain